jgi:hypothetical protein
VTYQWIVYDHSGEEIRQTEGFSSRSEAEEWMRARWSSLVEEGGAGVRLTSDGEVVYDMGLAES